MSFCCVVSGFEVVVPLVHAGPLRLAASMDEAHTTIRLWQSGGANYCWLIRAHNIICLLNFTHNLLLCLVV